MPVRPTSTMPGTAAAHCPRCRHCRRASHRRASHRRRGRLRTIAVTAALAAAGAIIAATAVTSPGPPPDAAIPAHQVFRICPVADCSAYPDPAGIKGVALSSLENWLLFLRSARAQIDAVSNPNKSWNGNAVRVQVLQDKLVGPNGHGWSPRYFQAVRNIIGYALSRDLTVILNDQTEAAIGFPQDEPGPGAATYAFWKHFTQVYGHNPHVIFDLFNEPRCKPYHVPAGVCGWGEWQAAMWPLVRAVRSYGSLNQLWLEGKRWASQLGGVPLIPCHKAVAWCQGIVYSFHKPGCPWPSFCPPSPAIWQKQFGYLAARGVPVTNGEMANYRGGFYWSNSTQTMTRYLAFLSSHHIGIVAWSLQAGIMTATTNLTSAVSEPQGAGRVFWKYFHGTLFAPPRPAGEGEPRHPGLMRWKR